MYYHKCDKPIFASKTLIIQSGISITSNGVIQTGKASLSGTIKSFNFSCTSCGEIKDAEEVFSRCMCCGNKFNLNKLFTLSTVGGVYCEDCHKENYSDFRKFNLGTIFQKAIVKG